jgi:DNA (cytosine-5)-methyltransferase 1
MSLGFERAGFDVVAAVELDPVHAATHKFNFPNCAMLARSVIGLSAKQIRKAAGLGNTPVDVVFGGAPCQGFSLIGHRALNDPRNRLVREFVRIVRDLDARYFLFENVAGLTVGKHKRFLLELVREFKKAGYWVREPWQVLNASSYSVPQNRRRLFLIGAKKGLNLPDYPKRQTYAKGEASEDLSPVPTCAEALGDLPDADDYVELLGSDEVAEAQWGEPSAYARRLRCLDNDSYGFGYPRLWDPSQLTSSLRTEHTAISRRRFAGTAPATVEPISRFYKLSGNGVSNTLRAGTDSARGAFTSPRPIHYSRHRCITVREMARLHGFPDWFRFHETKWHGARQVGNAVPPPLAEAVATEILRALGIDPERPATLVPLADATLLRFSVSQASDYWGVTNPISRRDRKSGARKRKQVEIEQARLISASQI